MAEKPPPSHVFEQVALMAAEDIGLGNKVLPPSPRGDKPSMNPANYQVPVGPFNGT